MANLLQEPFKPWVKEQIEVRQKSLGKGFKESGKITDKDLKFYSSNMPFLRLVSSVNVTDTEDIELEYYNESQLAQLKRLEAQGDKEQTLEIYYRERQKFINENGLNGQPLNPKVETFTFPIKYGIIDKLINTSNGKLTKDDLINEGLAKNFILQGGAVSEGGKLNGGLNNKETIFNGAYGWGGISERGYVPMPGIESADVTYKNNGALSETTIKIKAYSREQFSLIDALYMRPGYTVLLEFGHTQWLDKDGNLQTWKDFYTGPYAAFMKGNKDQYELLKVITSEREKYQGNYEAIFGKITKFNWNVNDDGSYSIEIKVTGIGDVIESLKINLQQSTTTQVENDSEVGESDNTPPLVADRNKTSLNKFLYKLSNVARDKVSIAEVFRSIEPEEDSNILEETITNLISTTGEQLFSIFPDGDIKKPLVFNQFTGNYPLPPFDNFPIKNEENGIYRRFSKINEKVKVIKMYGIYTDDEMEEKVEQTYITFAHLLAFIESELMLYDGDTPLVRFDFDYYNPDKDENYMLTFPGQFSSDPRICLIPLTNNNVGGLESIQMRLGDWELWDEFNKMSYFTTNENGDNNQYVGRLGNIYLNTNFIAEKVSTSQRDEEGNVSILDFLDSLLSDVSIALGGINQFRVTFDEETGTIRFYEDAPQRIDSKTKPPETEYTSLNVWGVSPNEGSFVTNLGLDSELSNKFATQIAVGAQAGGNTLSANATSFSNYNKGLIDRVIKEKKSKSGDFRGTKSPKIELVNNWGFTGDVESGKIDFRSKGSQELLEENIIIPFTYVYMYGNNEIGIGGLDGEGLKWNQEYIDILNEFNKQYSSVVVGSLQEQNQLLPFFLPFNLKVEMLGISGIVLYQQFKIKNKVLPASYDDIGVNYIVKAINHQITPEGWKTEMETTPIPKENLSPTIPSPSTTQDIQGGRNSEIINNPEVEEPNNPGDKFLIIDKITDNQIPQYSTYNQEITVNDLIERFHPKGREQFRQFFTELETKYPGYTVRLNSLGRSLLKSQNLRKQLGSKQPYAGGSRHNYYMAIDMNVITPSGKTLRKSYGREQWIKTGIPDIAKKYGLIWGDFKTYKDYIHFGVPFDINTAKTNLENFFNISTSEYQDEERLKQIDNYTRNGGGIYKIDF